jgi:hypothetical protein
VTNFKRVRSLPPIATVREIVDAVNNLIRYGIQETGSLKLGVTTLTNAVSPYTIGPNDQFLRVDTSGGHVTINLTPKASEDGREVTIKKVTTDDNTVTIDGDSTDTIDGATTRTIYQPYGGLTLRCDASTGWDIKSWI